MNQKTKITLLYILWISSDSFLYGLSGVFKKTEKADPYAALVWCFVLYLEVRS